MKFTFALLALVGFLAAATPQQRRSYEDPLDPWRAFTKEAKHATEGNPFAVHTCFIAAYVRLNDPQLGGADLEEMTASTEKILRSLGDERFSKALSLERPEIAAAVGYFIGKSTEPHYPKTHRLIASAPKLQWQLNQATGDTDRCPLLQKFIDYEGRGIGW